METVQFFRQVERRVLPKLYGRIAESRIGHIRSVNHAFQAIIDRRFAALHEALPADLQKVTNPDEYGRRLEWVRRQYAALPEKEQRNLAAAVALHDIGYLLDRGVAHNNLGAQLTAGFLMETGTRGVDSAVVAELVGAHGFFQDMTSHLLPSDAGQNSEDRKTQLLLINLVDVIGKSGGNRLSQYALETMIAMRQGRFNEPKQYFALRMRTLLGPICYSYLADNLAHLTLLDTIEQDIPYEDKKALYRNVCFRFRNLSWPVFQELVMKHQGIRTFLRLLIRLSTLAEEKLPQEKDVLLVFKPDFLGLETAARPPYLEALKRSPNANFLRAKSVGEHGIIEIDLQKLLGARP
ncbi:MAG: hypothetical protein WC529_08370 [Candidatus Margulisiibacteriota bacterium]